MQEVEIGHNTTESDNDEFMDKIANGMITVVYAGEPSLLSFHKMTIKVSIKPPSLP